MTNTNYQPHRLLLNNIKIFEDAEPILHEIGEKISDHIDQVIQNWIKNQESEWDAKYGGYIKDTYFYPIDWKSDQLINISRFHLGFNNNKDSYWLTSLFGLGENQYGIHWHFPYTQAKNKRNRTQWKEFLTSQFNQYLPVFLQNGVELSEDKTSLFMPLKIDLQRLSENYPDGLSEALEPLDILLENL